jgi:hypothetical protein
VSIRGEKIWDAAAEHHILEERSASQMLAHYRHLLAKCKGCDKLMALAETFECRMRE